MAIRPIDTFDCANPWVVVSTLIESPGYFFCERHYDRATADQVADRRIYQGRAAFVAWQGLLYIQTDHFPTAQGQGPQRLLACRAFVSDCWRGAMRPIMARKLALILGVGLSESGDLALPVSMVPQHGEPVALRNLLLVRV